METRHFLRLFNFNKWANKEVMKSIHSQEVSDEIIRKMVHVMWAEWAWLQRVQGKVIDRSTIVELISKDELQLRLNQNSEAWIQFIEETEDFEKIYDYQLLNGTESTSYLSDILTHVVNHGSYHRGQIATLLRQDGLIPNPTDFIQFSRSC